MLDALEIGRGWVWTPFTVPARTPELQSALGEDDDTGITSSLKEQ